MNGQGQRAQALDEARSGSRDHDVVDGSDRSVLDRSHATPARSLREIRGLDAVGSVAEDDHLRVG